MGARAKAGHVDGGDDLAGLHLLDGVRLAHIDLAHAHAALLEQFARHELRAAADVAEINRLALEVAQGADLGPGEEM